MAQGWLMAIVGFGLGLVAIISAMSEPDGFGRAIPTGLGLVLMTILGLPGLIYVIVVRFMRRVRLWPTIVLALLSSLQVILGCMWFYRMAQQGGPAAMISLGYLLFHQVTLVAAFYSIQAARRYVPAGSAFEPIMSPPLKPILLHADTDDPYRSSPID